MNIGVIGYGRMGKHHCNIYRKIKGIKNVYICDSKYKGFNLDKLLKIKLLDAVSICTPDETHYEIARKCLQNKVHVLVEKPFVLNPKHGKELIRLAKKNKCILMVGHLTRFNPAIQFFIKNKKKLGKIKYIKVQRTKPPVKGYKKDLLFDIGVHDFDLFNWLFGIEFKKVCIANEKDYSLIISKEKIPLLIEISLLNERDIRNIRFIGSKGIMDITLAPKPNIVFHQKGKVDFCIFGQYSLRNELKHFIDCIKNKKKPLVDGEAGLKAVEIARRLK